MSISWPGPLHTPVITFDPDHWAKERIKKWMRDTDVMMYGSYDGEVDDDDIVCLLLKFEKYLAECEVKRQRNG